MADDDICPICMSPRKASGEGSLTQWIVACDCDLADTEEAQKLSISMCRACGKRIGEGRAGSFTQFIFRSDICRCENPRPYKVSAELAGGAEARVDDSQEFFDDSEEGLGFEEDRFPSDRYKPLRELGKGGGGSVYLARDKLLNKAVAVKLLHILEPQQLIAFQEEARATSKLSHQAIVEVLDFGVTAIGVPYMVLEFVPGRSLEELLAERGRLDWSSARDITCQVLGGIGYAHERGIYHRDITPSNILLIERTDGTFEVRIIDFGIAKIDDGRPRESMGSKVVGAPLYMSPDQGLGLPYDTRSEVYAIGCVLFEMLAGEPPFSGETALQTLSMHAESERPSLSERSGLAFTPELEAILARALAVEPEERFQSPSEFAWALQELKEGLLLPEGRDNSAPHKADKSGRSRLVLVLSFIAATCGLVSVDTTIRQQGRMLQPVAISRVLIGPGATNKIDAEDVTAVSNEYRKILERWRILPPLVEIYEARDSDMRELREEIEKRNLEITSILMSSDSPLTSRGLRSLKGIPLRTFEADAGRFNDDSARALKLFPDLRVVRLQATPLVTIEGIKAITELPNLTYLAIRFTRPLPKGTVEQISKMDRLTSIDLGHSRSISPEDIRTLTKMPRLRSLKITNTGLDDRVVPILVDSRIELLEIGENEITDEGLLGLARMKSMRNLKISAAGGIISKDGLKQFKRLRPDVSIKSGTMISASEFFNGLPGLPGLER
ncbi:MAG: serine/threonine protein kinase [Candidatus Melainabacteria bacterium]|nr:serine/threonine protein kinase [Candidatus Melainabacteria bacterium]